MASPDPSSVRLPGPWRHRDIHANGIRLHAAEAGPTDPAAPLVILLHGFADFWWTWRYQLPALAAAGHHCLAVDLRGYGDSDKPPRGYDGWTLAGDVSGLIRALGHTRAALVGHADGGLVAWAMAALHPHHVSRVAVISAPHPLALRRAVLRDRAQRRALLRPLLRDQLPWWPERRLQRDDGAEVERLLRAHCGPRWGATPEFGDAAHQIRSAVQIPGAAHCALEYHRWALRSQLRPDGRRFRQAMDRRIDLPVLALRGDADPYVYAGAHRRSRHWAPAVRVTSLPTGHLPHQERPDDTNAELVRFLAEPLR